MSKHSRKEEERQIDALVEKSDAKYDNIRAGVDVGSMVLLAGSVVAGAMIGTPLSIGLGFAGLCLFGTLNIASRFIIESKKTTARREIVRAHKEGNEKQESNSKEEIFARDKATSEQLDMMHQFEIDEIERNGHYALGEEDSLYFDKLERRMDKGFFNGRYDRER